MINVGELCFVDTLAGPRRAVVVRREEEEVLVEFTSNLLQTWVDEDDIKETDG